MKQPSDLTARTRTTMAFQWVMGVASLVLCGGGILDDWAHFHGLVDQSFFTPWHAVMYGGLTLFGVFLGALALRNLARGYLWCNSLPPGYMLSLIGVAVFAVAGVLDLVWHTLFGIEHDVAAFVSPTHILLCIGGLLVVTGPLRAAWLTLPPEKTHGWGMLGPMLLSATSVLATLAMFTQFASPINNLLETTSAAFGIAQAVIQSILVMGIALALVRTWQLPFGAMTLLVGLPSVAQLIMRDHFWFFIGVIGSGFFADCLLRWLSPPVRGKRLYLFAAVVAAVYEASILVTQGLTTGLDLSPNLIAGSILYAAATGLFLAFLLDWPIQRITDVTVNPMTSDRGLEPASLLTARLNTWR